MARIISQSNISAYYGIPASADFEMKMFDTTLPLPAQKCTYSSCLIGVCTSGHATFSVLGVEHTLIKNEIICLLSGHFVSLDDVSSDFLCCWGVISKSFMTDLTSRFPNVLFEYLNMSPNSLLSNHGVEEAIKYFNLIELKMNENGNKFQKDIIFNILYSFMLDMYNIVNRNLPDMPMGRTSNERIFDKFHILVSANIRNNLPITFYADALNVSPKHLSKVVKIVKGVSVKRWIDQRMVVELKKELLSSTESLKEISLDFNFSSCDSMHHFFRKHTGVSPSTYRIDTSTAK